MEAIDRNQDQQPQTKQQRQPVKKRQDLHKMRSFKMTQHQSQQMMTSNHSKRRSRQITICVFCFISAICCLNPFTSIHLTQRIGLLLFESDLLQLRSSFICLIICSLLLVSVNLVFMFLFRKSQSRFNSARTNSKDFRRLRSSLLSKLLGLAAIISAVSYLSLVLVVPHIKQIQRMPTASFDCNANLITIENCQQQFTTYSSDQSTVMIVDAVKELLFGDLNGNNERLIEKFNCLKYNTRTLDSLEVPTRFLLHNCGLVCKPHRQQVHQFSDDLNVDQSSSSSGNYPKVIPEDDARISGSSNEQLRPPYSTEDGLNRVESLQQQQQQQQHYNQQQQAASQVSMRVCFSGEFSGGSNYKQFCITNLANRPTISRQESELTVGQLNAMLRSMTPNEKNGDAISDADNREMNADHQQASDIKLASYSNDNQATQYVNPVVQFESHFKNWPHLPSSTIFNSGDHLGHDDIDNEIPVTRKRNHFSNSQENYCKFRPIPPFIVNNKPFSDIQCSVEQEYTITTGPSIDSTPSARRSGRSDRIFLKKSTMELGTNENMARERCNIQCKVNILYQVHLSNHRHQQQQQQQQKKNKSKNEKQSRGDEGENNEEATNYYLPLKPCIIVSGDGDKTKTSSYYLTIRATGDTSLILTFVLLDLIFLLETIDTNQFQFESRKLRLVGLLLIVTLLPLFVALAFDLTTDLSPNSNTMNKGRRDGYLVTLVNDKIIPTISDLIQKLIQSDSSKRVSSLSNPNHIQSRQHLESSNKTSSFYGDPEFTHASNDNIYSNSKLPQTYQLDNFMLPFFLYAIFMFALAISSFTLPQTPLINPLVRISSIEELGMLGGSHSSEKNQDKKSFTGSTNLSLEPPETFRDQYKEDDSNLSVTKRDIDKSNINPFGRRSPKRQERKVVLFALASLFMGLQFNLSQFVQLQMFIEAFGNPGIPIGQDYAASKFLAQTHSLAILLILFVVLIFLDESSTFLATFSLFKTSTSTRAAQQQNDTEQEGDQCQVGESKLTGYLTISLIIYAIRYYVLAELNPMTKFKWLVVSLFQVAEILNFPLTWFALCSRGHELLMALPAYIRFRNSNQSNLPARESQALDAHLIVQSTLGVIYFVIGRFLALFSHSLHASLYLHSENVDWFIANYYRNRNIPNRTGSHLPEAHRGALNSTNFNGGNVAATTVTSATSSGDSLFSPLPDERQTYLHASRLFIKYNSLLCFLLGSSLLMVLLFRKYKLWLKHRRRIEVEKQLERQRRLSDASEQQRRGSNLNNIDERLSSDLKRIHGSSSSLQVGSRLSSNTRMIYPRPSGSSSLSSSLAMNSRDNLLTSNRSHQPTKTPRAKILFKYDLAHRKQQANSSSDEGDDERESRRSGESPLNFANKFKPKSKVATVPELAEEEELDNISLDIPPPPSPTFESQPDSARVTMLPAQEEEEEEEDKVIREPRAYSKFQDEASQQPKEYVVRDFPFEGPGQTVERVVKHRNKRVRIFEDREEWPAASGNVEQEDDGLPMANDRFDGQISGSGPAGNTTNTKPRNISFAPTTTLISDARDGTTYSRPIQSASGRRLTNRRFANSSRGGGNLVPPPPKQASPEPSIESDGGGDHQEHENQIDELDESYRNKSDDNSESNEELDSIEQQHQRQSSRRRVNQTEF